MNPKRTLHFFAPSFDLAPYKVDGFEPSSEKLFSAISITGRHCQLQCDHCKGFLLRGMEDGTSNLLELLESKIKGGTKGFLVSGGADLQGKVPFKKALPILGQVKRAYGVHVVIHSGYMEADELRLLKDAGLDGIMFDIPTSREVMKRVCHLDRGPEEYIEMMHNCKKLGIPVMPHLVLGLDNGALGGEMEVIDILARDPPDVLVIVVLMPQPGTPMADVSPPELSGVKEIMKHARHELASIPLVLGCAKPPGDYKEDLERAAVGLGFDGITYPLQETIDHVASLGIPHVFHETCCSLISMFETDQGQLSRVEAELSGNSELKQPARLHNQER